MLWHCGCDILSCDSQAAIPRLIASRVEEVITVYGEHWLAWLKLPAGVIARLPRAFILASLVSVAYTICEL